MLNYLDNMPLVDRKSNAPLIMPISEKYGDMGSVIVGKVESGRIRKGQNLLLMPNKVSQRPRSKTVVSSAHHAFPRQTPVQVSGLVNEVEEEITGAICGDNIRVRLRGVEDEDISVGFVLTSTEKPVHAVTRFEAQLVILDHKNIITAGYGAVMHVHTLSEEVNLVVR